MSDDYESVQRLSRDLAKAATTLSHDEARFLVDAYYTMQEDRIRSDAQVRALTDSNEPHDVLRWLGDQAATLESQIRRALAKYADSLPLGRWAQSVKGIGPVIAAGLLAHIDMEKSVTAGDIWRFAGLDPTCTWERGQRRPWNATLKTLCWKIGESFVKVSGSEDAYYGQVYRRRKAWETDRNLQGAYSQQAAAALEKKKIGKDTDAYLWYAGCLTAEAARSYYETPAEQRQGRSKQLAGAPGSGVAMLPPAHIQARAKRYAVKLFLAHYHEMGYKLVLGKPAPLPYPIAILGHAHYLPPPEAAA